MLLAGTFFPFLCFLQSYTQHFHQAQQYLRTTTLWTYIHDTKMKPIQSGNMILLYQKYCELMEMLPEKKN